MSALPEPLLTLDGVAELLGVSRRTVERLVQHGELVPFRIGTRLRFDPVEVREYLETTRNGRRRPAGKTLALRAAGGARQSFADRVRSLPR